MGIMLFFHAGPVLLAENDLGFYQPPGDRALYKRSKNQQPKNIVFFIGDGMGLSQVAGSRMVVMGASGRLYMEKFPVTGLVNTSSLDSLTTDSAAAGTALATGHKTYNYMVSLSPNNIPFTTILEAAKKKGMATGLIATSTISHATPATFSSHVPSRSDEDKIAEQIVDQGFNIVLGGGEHFFIPRSEEGSRRKDELDLLDRARKKGYTIVRNRDELQAADTGNQILGLFQMDMLDTEAGNEPSLSEMTAEAIKVLMKDKDGFFLVVEGSQIDWACHENNEDKMIRQVLLLDMAVKTAVELTLKEENTLILVLADHETGSLTLKGSNLNGTDIIFSWGGTDHSCVPVPIFAFGPGAENFTGLHDNTEIPKITSGLVNIPLK